MANGQVQHPRKQYASFLPEVFALMIVSGAGYLTWRYFHSVLEIGVGIAIIGLLFYRFQGWVINKLLWDRWRHRVFPAFRRLGGSIADHPPYLRRAERLPHGFALYLTLYDGITYRDLQNGADSLASSLKANRVIVRPDGKAHHAIMEVQYGDPFGDPPHSGSYAAVTEPAHVGSVTLPIGQDESGHEVSVRLGGGLVVGGLPGSGKSNLVHQLIAEFTQIDGAILGLVDPKRVELSGWRACATYFGVSEGDALGILDAVIAAMEERYRDLEQRGTRSVAPDVAPILVVIEETTALLSSGTHHSEIELRLHKLMSLGRAAHITVVLVAQRPSVDVVPASLRDLAETRIAFRTSTPDMSDVILGRGWASRGFDASSIEATQRGVGYFYGGDGDPKLFRTSFLSDNALRERQQRRSSGPDSCEGR